MLLVCDSCDLRVCALDHRPQHRVSGRRPTAHDRAWLYRARGQTYSWLLSARRRMRRRPASRGKEVCENLCEQTPPSASRADCRQSVPAMSTEHKPAETSQLGRRHTYAYMCACVPDKCHGPHEARRNVCAAQMSHESHMLQKPNRHASGVVAEWSRSYTCLADLDRGVPHAAVEPCRLGAESNRLMARPATLSPGSCQGDGKQA